MAPPPYSSSPDVRDVIDDYIIVVDACRTEELGTVCKAFDRSRRSRSRYVALLRLHEWCQHLPETTRTHLKEAVCAVKALKEEQDANARSSALIYVLNSSLCLQPEPAAKAGLSKAVEYIVTEWVEEISLPELVRDYLQKPSDAVAFVYELATQLSKIYSQSLYLYPVISLQQLKRKPDGVGRESIVLDGWRFETVLDDVSRTPIQTHKDVNSLATLLLQLLDGIWLYAEDNVSPATQATLSSQLLSVENKFTSVGSAQTERNQIWQLLDLFLTQPADGKPTLTLADFVNKFQQHQALAQPLDVSFDSLRKNGSPVEAAQHAGTTNGHSPEIKTQPASPTETEKEKQLALVKDQYERQAQYDRLRIDYVREQIRYGQNLFRPHEETINEAPAGDGIYVVGEAAPGSAIYHWETGEDLKNPKILELLQQRRLYLQRHPSQQAGQNSHYYTVAVLGYVANGYLTTLNRHKISPLFAVLLTPDATLEVGQDYRIKLLLASVPAPGSWVAAKMEGLTALTVDEQRFTVAPGAQLLTVSFTATNPTVEVDRLTVVVDGMPPDWPPFTPIQLRLFDKESKSQTLSILLPPFRSRGDYEFTVRLISDNVGAQVAATSIYVTVPPQVDYTSYLQPQALRVGDIGEIYLQNHGNLDQDFFITLRDQANELIFEPSQLFVTIQARQEGIVGYRPYARQWRLLGQAKRHEMNVLVAPQYGGLPQTLTGQVYSRALIPAWAPIILGVLLVSLFLLFSFLFIPEFVQTGVKANGMPVDAPIAGEEITLNWTSLNTCLYSVYQNDRALVWREWQSSAAIAVRNASSPRYSYTVQRPANAGDKLELRLHGCTFFPSKSWQVEVRPAATSTPTPGPLPVIEQFALSVEGLPQLQVDALGRVTPVDSSVQDVTQLLVGQQGELCFQWRIANVSEGSFKLQITPLIGEVAETAGERCFPIAATFPKAQERISFVLHLADAAGTEVATRELSVQIVAPICYVNVQEPLYIREGPGRNFPDRGELIEDAIVFPVGRPFFPHDQLDAVRWVQVTLPSDPRPVWIAYDYLRCPVDIWALPDPAQIPATPTPTPTLTPEPTITPTPEVTPEVVIMPEVITLGGCAIFKWKIQNVKAVYLNDEGVVGEAEKTICPSASGQLKFTWRIEHADGTIVLLERTLIVNPTVSPAPTPPQ